MSGPESNYAAWIEKAEHDLLSIENNIAAERVPWGTLCFHAQQAAEKLLKGYLIYKIRPLPSTHDLVSLLAECVEVDPGHAGLEADCKLLTVYADESGYPEMWLDPDEAEVHHAVEAARRVRSAILALLPRPGG